MVALTARYVPFQVLLASEALPTIGTINQLARLTAAAAHFVSGAVLRQSLGIWDGAVVVGGVTRYVTAWNPAAVKDVVGSVV